MKMTIRHDGYEVEFLSTNDYKEYKMCSSRPKHTFPKTCGIIKAEEAAIVTELYLVLPEV